MSGANTNGWGWPTNSRKAHYFMGDTISVCRKWMYGGALESETGKRSPDDCARCVEAVANLQRCPACSSEATSKKPTWCSCNKAAPHRRIATAVTEVVDAVVANTLPSLSTKKGSAR